MRRAIITTLFLICMALACRCYATNYYVSTTGNNGNPGTEASPWRNVDYAVDNVVAGDTIFLRAGEYNELVTVTVSGSAGGGYITLRSYAGETGAIDGTGLGGSAVGLITMTDVSYWKLQFLEVRDVTGAGIFYQGTGSHIEITNNEIHHGNQPSGGTYGHGILVTSRKAGPIWGTITDVVIDSNNIHDWLTGAQFQDEVLTLAYNVHYARITNNTLTNFRNIGINLASDEVDASYSVAGFPRYVVISGNTVNFGSVGQFSEDSGIYVNSVQDVVIENNYVYGGRCAGIAVGHEQWSTLIQARVIVRRNRIGNQLSQIIIGGTSGPDEVTYTRVVHNSLWFSTDLSSGFVLGDGGTSNIVKNNIQQNLSTYYHTRTYQGSSTYTFNYNLWHPGTGDGWHYISTFYSFAGWQAIPQDAQGLTGDPLFINPSAGDFHLGASSPAINAGQSLTTTNGAGSSSPTVIVNDPYYFTDGYTLQTGDVIRVGSNTVTITAVNYGTSTLTVTPSISWSNGDSVSYPYNGSAPDIGAYEFGSEDPTITKPSSPRGFFIIAALSFPLLAIKFMRSNRNLIRS